MKQRMKLLSLLLAGSIFVGAGSLYVEAAQGKNTMAPVAGVAGIFMELMTDTSTAIHTDGETATDENGQMAVEARSAETSGAEASSAEATAETGIVEHEIPVAWSEYTDVAIAQVNNYVNVRSEPNTDSEILGKLYNNSAATVFETTEDGWYRIQSGSVNGYVKAEYVVVGNEELARAVSTRYATVTTTTLFVRTEPTTEAKILTMLPEGDDLEVVDETQEGWVKVSTVEGEGYVSTDYIALSTEYVQAESKEEEEARLAKEEAERQAAIAAAEAARAAREAEEKRVAQQKADAQKAAEKKQAQSSNQIQSSNQTQSNSQAQSNSQTQNSNQSAGGNTSSGSSNTGSTQSSVSNGQAVVDYAKQFLGNPYVYGGTSLTNGIDCSAFVMKVYAAFGVSLPRNSAAQRSAGYAVSLENIQPGDIVCYSGHVGIYAGNNTIVHASNERTGITLTSPVTYRKVLAVRRIF